MERTEYKKVSYSQISKEHGMGIDIEKLNALGLDGWTFFGVFSGEALFMRNTIKGVLYKHYKGGMYRVINDSVTHTETGEELVMYTSLETGLVWARPKEMFHELIMVDGNPTYRFTKVQEGQHELQVQSNLVK